jgi:hypothetical protein
LVWILPDLASAATHLRFRDILDTVLCVIRALGMKNIWFLSVLL